MEEAINYFDNDKEGHNYEIGVALVNDKAKLKKELKENKNIKICSDECLHLHDPSLPKKDSPTPTSPISPKNSGAGKTPNSKNNQLKDNEKSQILSYFIEKNISKISLENDKLTIFYNDNTKKVIESEDQQLQKYHQYIKNLPHQSLSFSELQKNNSNDSSTPNKSNIGIYIGLTAGGAFILGGIFIYFLVRKKKK